MFGRRINYRQPLYICEIYKIVGKETLGYGNRYTKWDYKEQVYFCFQSIKILIKEEGCYYKDPITGEKFSHGYGYNPVGTLFVKRVSYVMFEQDSRVSLTKRELKTGKISPKRFRAIEEILNK